MRAASCSTATSAPCTRSTPRDSQEIKEYIAHSWYSYDGGNDKGIHPWAGETNINYTGPKPPFETLEGYEKYSFLKTPRWKENADGSGPAGAPARLLCLRPRRM